MAVRGLQPARRSFGEVTRLPSGKFRARYWGPDGVRYSAPHTYLQRDHADWFLTDVEREISQGTWTKPVKASVALVTRFDAYAQQRLDARRNRVVKPLKLSTFELYKKLIRLELVDTFGALEITAITPAHVEQWHAASLARGNPTQTGNAYMLLKSILTDAVKVGLILANPATVEGAGKPAPRHSGEILTHEQVLTYLDAVPEHRRMPLFLMAATGLRVGECLALRRMDVDLATGAVHVRRTVGRVGRTHHFDTPKTAAGARTVFLPDSVRDALKAWIAAQPMRGRDALLFPASDGQNPLSEHVLREAHVKGREAVGRDFTMHDLRRTAATMAAHNGATVKELMRLLGHTTAAVAMIYQKAEDARMKSIAAGWDAAHKNAGGV